MVTIARGGDGVTTIHLGDCSTDCPICVANCNCGNCDKSGEGVTA
jgi:hypothetical protein